METVVQDLRLAVRSLIRSPVFTLIAVASIALGIGFNAAIFSAVNALLLRPVDGLSDPGRVVEVGRTDDGRGFDSFSHADLLALRESVTALEHLSAWRMGPLSFGAPGGGERVVGMNVSAGYFEALGVPVALGRSIAPHDDRAGAPPVAVVSHRFWRERLGGAPDVVGRVVDINRVPVTVIGVAAQGFTGHFPLIEVEVWLPFLHMALASPGTDPRIFDSHGYISHQVVGRLASGATLAQANAALATVMARLEAEHPDTNEGRGATAVSLGPIPGGGRTIVAGFLGVLMGLVVLILLVAAANVAGMLLARAAAREKEIAIRLAIGSGRARLVRQLVAESLVLFLVGAAGGLLIAWWATTLLSAIPAPGMEIVLDLAPDGAVLGFALALAALTGLLFGLVPALQSSRPELVSALKDEGRTGRRGARTRRAFVVVQVALSLTLLTAAGLLVRSLGQANRMSGGFDAAGIRMVSLGLALDGYTPETTAPFQDALRRALIDRPGIDAVALANDLPMDLSENGAPIWTEGAESEDRIQADFNAVSPGYFETLRIPLLRGRDFGEADREGAPRVAIVSEALARRVWGEADPLGRRIRWARGDDEPRTVIGVVGEVKNQTLGETVDGMVYLPLAQRHTADVHVLARGPGVTGTTLRAGVLAADPRLSLSDPQSLEAVTGVGLLPARVAALVASLLGGLGLFLAVLGVYGVVAHGVVQRRREIGIRMAIGARAPDVSRMVVLGGLRLALPGLIVGAAGAVAVGRLLRGMLLGISPSDPATLAAVGALLVGSVALASWIPARRASAVDPIEALRSE